MTTTNDQIRSHRDDLGVLVDAPGPAGRVVSLVPSLTEAIAATRREALVGATEWCTHPADLDVTRVRGTKNPDRAAIKALRPDLVIANQEENRELDVRRLRDAGVAVWVTRIETVDEAFASLRRLFADALSWTVPDWLDDAESLWSTPRVAQTGPRVAQPGATRRLKNANLRHSADGGGARVAVPIWRDPWMVVGPNTFTTDLLRRLGWHNVFDGPGSDRYPHVDLEQIDRADVDLVLLPDEPYTFGPDDGPEAFTSAPTQLVSGRLLTWYGPSLLAARRELPTPAGEVR